MKFKFPEHSALFYVGIITTFLVTILIIAAIFINGVSQPWIMLAGMNLLGYALMVYIYLTE